MFRPEPCKENAMSRMPEAAPPSLVEPSISTSARATGGRWLVLAVLALGAWALSAGLRQASASQVVWSVGVQSPGAAVQIGTAPVVVVPAPVYHPSVRVMAPPVVVRHWDEDPYPYRHPRFHRHPRHHGHPGHHGGYGGHGDWRHDGHR
jgi:hypothetical protein